MKKSFVLLSLMVLTLVGCSDDQTKVKKINRLENEIGIEQDKVDLLKKNIMEMEANLDHAVEDIGHQNDALAQRDETIEALESKLVLAETYAGQYMYDLYKRHGKTDETLVQTCNNLGLEVAGQLMEALAKDDYYKDKKLIMVDERTNGHKHIYSFMCLMGDKEDTSEDQMQVYAVTVDLTDDFVYHIR